MSRVSRAGDVSPEALQRSLQSLSSASASAFFDNPPTAAAQRTPDDTNFASESSSSSSSSPSSSSPSPSPSWWQQWSRADWHLLKKLPTSLDDVTQLSAALRTVGERAQCHVCRMVRCAHSPACPCFRPQRCCFVLPLAVSAFIIRPVGLSSAQPLTCLIPPPLPPLRLPRSQRGSLHRAACRWWRRRCCCCSCHAHVTLLLRHTPWL